MRASHKSWVVRVLGPALFVLAAVGALTSALAQTPENLFSQTRKEYSAALAIQDKQARIEALQKCVRGFREVINADNEGKFADKCTYLIGQSYHSMHDLNKSPEDLRSAVESYRTVVERYPASPLADDAQYLIGVLYTPEDPAQAYVEFAKVRLFFPKGDMRARAEQGSAQLAKQLGCDRAKKKTQSISSRVKDMKGSDDKAETEVKSGDADKKGSKEKNKAGGDSRTGSAACPTLVYLERIQHWSAEDYTRVVLYTSGPLNYKEQAIPANPKKNQPGRISVELMECAVNPKMKSRLRIMDRILQEVRAEQSESTLAKVVLDTRTIDSYRIFPLTDPARLIIDVRGASPKVEAPPPALDADAARKQLPTLARQLALDVKCIVLDPGHGGKDKGAIGPNNVYEKDIVLSIAKRLKKVLEAKTGCSVVLTRTKDRYVSLEERTAIANSQKADLFVSIHTNAHEDRQYKGIETYFLNLSKDKESARVAALENATSTKKVSDLEAILHDLLLNTKMNESASLARVVQKHTVSSLKTGYESVRDLGTKQAPFYVLLGAEMPSILIETAFITNAEEEGRLKDSAFQEKLAKGISAGIESYIRQMKGLAKRGDQT